MPRPLARCSRTPICVRRNAPCSVRWSHSGAHCATCTSIAPFLADLGARHARYGVGAEHYPLVGAALLETMAEVAGAAWQPAFTTEWARAYQLVAQIMIDGAEQSAAAA